MPGKRVLEVDFRLGDVEVMAVDGWTGELKIVNSLAKFREKSRMRVVWVRHDGSDISVIYSSDGVM